MKYRVEHTKKPVQAIGADGHDTEGLADVTIVWDDEENIGVEYETPFCSYIVSDPEKGESPFLTEAGRARAREIAKQIERYVKEEGILNES